MITSNSKSNIQPISNFFVSGNKLSAIGLLQGEKETFNDFKLTEKKPELRIDDKLIEILKKYLVDLVIYAGEKTCDKCALFEILHEDFSNKKYTLREFVTNRGENDISLNRCALEGIRFLPDKFKIGFPTPGKKNLFWKTIFCKLYNQCIFIVFHKMITMTQTVRPAQMKLNATVQLIKQTIANCLHKE